ncbi:MAG: dihydroxy-acid dehydratase [Pseudomonas sp.]
MGTAIALSHNMFDAALCLGICDKIVPGPVIGALRFGHLPVVFVPGGPMATGLPTSEKSGSAPAALPKGKATREELLDAEMPTTMSPGTCTFYGTANTNQMLMEVMGLHLPGAAFVNPNTPLRDALTRFAVRAGASPDAAVNGHTRRMAEIVDEKAIVERGGRAAGHGRFHQPHPAPAGDRAAAGIQLTWEDMAELPKSYRSSARIYPNGKADINHFHAAGGMSYRDPRAARRRPAA